MNEVPTLPGRCHWHGCEQLTTYALEVELVPAGSRVARPPRRIPLCGPHRERAKQTGHINLAYHPDNTRPVNSDDRPYEDDPAKPLEEKGGKMPDAVEVYRDEAGVTRVRRTLG